jgi:superfamily II DNA/RNA helicase
VTALPTDQLTPARFEDFGLPRPLVSTLAASGITQPFAIQAVTLPDALAGRDILGRAKTGSGKTLGFSLPMVARLAGGPRTLPGRPRGLILVPTRELATQTFRVLRPLADAMGLTVTTVFGGMPYRAQVTAMRRGTDIVVACPGRLADLVDQGQCDLGDVAISVLDEADHMADLGFLPVVRRLLDTTPGDGQRLLFSATLDSAVDVLARRFLRNPARHSVEDAAPPAEMTHYLLTTTHDDRLGVLMELAGGDNRSLIFTRTKHGAKRLAKQLSDSGIPATELHGNLTQNARDRNLTAFSSGKVRVLVATDIAARGIHVDRIDLVIHADPPAEHKAYLHRSGRTARAGAGGTVVTMQLPSQAPEVRKLMQRAGVKPSSAKVSPGSPEVAEIAGPQAERVYRAWEPEAPANGGRPGRRSGGSGGGQRRRQETGGESRSRRPRGQDGPAQPEARSEARAEQGRGGPRRPAGRSGYQSSDGYQSGSRSQEAPARSWQDSGSSRQAPARSRQAPVRAERPARSQHASGGPQKSAARSQRPGARSRRTEFRGQGA